MNENYVDFYKECEEFTNLFKILEETIRKKCHAEGIKTDYINLDTQIEELSNKNSVVKRYKDELSKLRKIRNLNAHPQSSIYGYAVCPNPYINDRLKNIIEEINNPPKVYDKLCIKKSNMYIKKINDFVEPTIKDMIKNIYTHIPILDENDRLVGVFSENTLLDIVNQNAGIIVDENTKFSDIEKFLQIDKHSTEEFIFISKEKNIYDIEDIFKDYFIRKKRIGCVYITEKGKSNESIIGMLTAWDVLGK